MAKPNKPKKTWSLACFWATPENLDVAQSAFLECGAIGLEVDEGIVPEKPNKYSEGQIKVLAYFEQAENLFSQVEEKFFLFFKECGLSASELSWQEIIEEDWQGNFVKSCTSFKVEPEIYIVPSFELEKFTKENQNKFFIEMDPENAFGTGQHQTTQLCLKNIHELLTSNTVEITKAIDVGTGSGILAILMAKLGLNDVYGTETDEQALETAAKNAVKNGVELKFFAVDDCWQYERDAYDLVVANILAPVLIDMAENLSACLKADGFVILSGILVEQASKVISAYEAQGLKFIKQDNQDDWCSIMFRKGS